MEVDEIEFEACPAADDVESPDGGVFILCTEGGKAGSDSLSDSEVFLLSRSGGSTLDFRNTGVPAPDLRGLSVEAVDPIIDFLLDLTLEPEECSMNRLPRSRK